MKFIFSLLFCILSIAQGISQITIAEDAGVSRLMSDYVFQNQQQAAIKGWRIQIITTNDRRKMELAITKFNSLYPGVQSSWEQEVPFYKVKVGAYENKDEMQGLLLDLKREFPSAIPVVDNIRKTELIP